MSAPTPTTPVTPSPRAAVTIRTAPPGTVLAGVMRTQRRSLGLWTLAVCAVAAMYTAFYPSMGGAKMATLLESMPEEMITAMGFDALATAEGYVSSTVYALLGAILTLVCAIGLGARLVGGHEEDGTLELELSAPVARRQVYLERLVALWLTVLVLVTGLTVTLLVLSMALDLGLALGNLLAIGLGLVMFAGTLGTVALAVAAATGRRAIGLGVASALAVVSYLLSYLGPLVELDWMAAVSPYEWYIGGQPLTDGLDGGGLALLAGLALVAGLVGLLRFERRDVMV